MFSRENDSNRQRIDYHAAISGDLRLVSSGTAQEALAEDYASMLSIGMLPDEDEPFDTRSCSGCGVVGDRANTVSRTVG